MAVQQLVEGFPHARPESYRVSVEEYIRFRRDGFLIVRGLLTPAEIAELRQHSEDLIHGRIEVPHVDPPKPGATLRELETRILRIHMLHRHLEVQERYMLHPRLLDVLEAIIGPDILAMQTMLFIKGPGALGQGLHQDSYYIPTFPDTLCGAWIAIDRADTENGCMWMCPGSQHEPIYPPAHGHGYGNREIGDIVEVSGVGGQSNSDEDPDNGLKPIAAKYLETPAVMNPGDVVFFGGHVLHRSLSNKTTDRMRRSLVCHYSNARSYNTWDGGNHMHILARGATHLAYAQPKFGTPCAANRPERSRADLSDQPDMMMGMPDGTMKPQQPADEPHDH